MLQYFCRIFARLLTSCWMNFAGIRRLFLEMGEKVRRFQHGPRSRAVSNTILEKKTNDCSGRSSSPCDVIPAPSEEMQDSKLHGWSAGRRSIPRKICAAADDRAVLAEGSQAHAYLSRDLVKQPQRYLFVRGWARNKESGRSRRNE